MDKLNVKTAKEALVAERLVQERGNPALLLSMLEGLSMRRPEKEDLAVIWEERIFLKGFALFRLNREGEAMTCFALLPKPFNARIQIERALNKVNRGAFNEAAGLFKDMLEKHETELDTYSLCTLLGGYCLSLIQQGDFKIARRCLVKRGKILRQNPSPVLSFGSNLYAILLCLESNNFEEAASLLSGSLSKVDPESVNGFFLLHLQLRLHLARNDLKAAGLVLQDLKILTHRLQLPEGVLDFRLEEIEWNLRHHVFSEALHKIEDMRAKAAANQEEFLLFRLGLLRAQVLAKQKDNTGALGEIERTIAAGERRGYLTGLTWAFLHAAGISWTAGDAIKAKLFLNRGRRLASQLGLTGRHACLSYMLEVAESRDANASVLIGLAKYQEIGPELEYLLDFYGLATASGFTVTSAGRQTHIQESALRRMFLHEPGIFFFQSEALIIANLGKSKVKSANFEPESASLSAFRLLIEATHSKLGVSLAALHESRSPHRYREDLHSASTKMLLSRLRQEIAGCALDVTFHRPTNLYSLKSTLPIYVITTTAYRSATITRNREQELLARIAMQPFVSTSNLCREFGVTRQALHPLLKKLTAQGRIRAVRRGPISGYIFSGKFSEKL